MDKMKYCIAKFCFISIAMSLILSGLLTACRLEGDIEALRKKSVANTGTSISAPDTPIVAASDSVLTVSWTAVDGAESYEVFISTAQNPPAVPERTILETTTIFTGLLNRTIYYVWVKAVNETGASGFSPRASGIPWPANEIPAAPGRPTVIAGKNQLTVNWEASGGASSYEVWKGTANNSASAEKHGADVLGASATLAGLVNGTTYYVWLKAKNDTGTSGFSPSANGKPLDTPGVPSINPGYKQLTVSWTTVAGADEYEVYYGTSAAPTTLATTTTSGTSATITGLTNGTTYYVRLRAKNANGVSDYGPSASGVSGLSPGLYRNDVKIGDQNLNASLTYINANAQTGDNFYIVLGADESTLAMRDLNYSGKTVGITLLGYGGERTISLSLSGNYLFGVYDGVTFTLDEKITLNGNYSLEGVRVSGGTLTMNSGTISGFHTGVNVSDVSGGTFTMNNGTISGNTARGVFVQRGTFTMNGGIIKGTISNGGVNVGYYGTFIMNNGTISGNENTGQQGGGVNVDGTFTMYNGVISGNTAARFGGGVFVVGHGSFSMHGGVISGNTAKEGGGGVFVSSSGSGTFRKLPNGGGQNSGIIYGNEETGVDAGGAPLKNTTPGYSHAVYTSSGYRNTTAGQTDQINSTTGRGLSATGNAPFGN